MHIFNGEFGTVLHSFRLAVYGDFHVCGVVPGLYGDKSCLRFQIHHRRNFDAGGAVLQQLKMFSRNGNQVDSPVKSAVEGEVRLLRVHRVTVFIADGYGKNIFLSKLLRQLHTKGGVTTFVMGKLFPVEINVGCHGGSVDFEKQAFTGCFFLRQFPDVPACAAIIVIPTVLPVHSIPGVGEADGLSRGSGFHRLLDRSCFFQKLPSGRKGYCFTHSRDLLYEVLRHKMLPVLQPFCRRCASAHSPSLPCPACRYAWQGVCR